MRPISERDMRLIARLAMALAEHAGRELDAGCFERARWLLMREGAPLEDRTYNGFGVDIQSVIR